MGSVIGKQIKSYYCEPRPPTKVSQAFWPELSGSVPETWPQKQGCRRGPKASGVSKRVPTVTRDCPGHLFDTSGILAGHFLDTPEHIPGTSLGHPRFWGHSRRHSLDTSGQSYWEAQLEELMGGHSKRRAYSSGPPVLLKKSGPPIRSWMCPGWAFC